MEPLCTGKVGARGPTADNRMFIKTVLWMMPAPAARGGICPKNLANGTACCSATAAGLILFRQHLSGAAIIA